MHLRLTEKDRGQEHPALRHDSHLSAATAHLYESRGQWSTRPLRHLLSDVAGRAPNALAGETYDDNGRLVERATYAELDRRAKAIATVLLSVGVAKGDVVAVMMPNSIDYSATVFAILAIGAVYAGIPVAYGPRESSAILKASRARALVSATGHRSVDLVERHRAAREELPNLRALIFTGPGSPHVLPRAEEYILGTELASASGSQTQTSAVSVDPGDVCQLGFTSGTTGDPKGVMNTHQTLRAVFEAWVQHVGREMLGDPVVNLVASPMGHHTGFLWGTLMTTYLGGVAVYLDSWSPRAAREAIRTASVSAMFGAPTFLQDLLSDTSSGTLTPLRVYVMAGAPIPRSLPEQAAATLGCAVIPAWGMTEYGIGISWSPRLPDEALKTEGMPVPGCEARIVHEDGREADTEAVGELQIRGPGLFVGYYDQPEITRDSFTRDGWFRTGDMAKRCQAGWIELVGRKKDIIIRGGENIPAHVIETLLFEYAPVSDVAVVAIPDERLGETACAVVVARAGAPVTLESLCRYLKERGLSPHYLPEHLDLVSTLPRTPSGKVRKVELRQALVARPPSESRVARRAAASAPASAGARQAASEDDSDVVGSEAHG